MSPCWFVGSGSWVRARYPRGPDDKAVSLETLGPREWDGRGRSHSLTL